MAERILVISEALKKPFDEGVKIFVYNFIKELSKNYTVLGLSRTNELDGEIEDYCKKALPSNKLFISSFLKKTIRAFNPDLIYYLPTAHATIYSFLRAKVLKLYGREARTVLVTLQPRKYNPVSKRIIPFIVPDLALAQSLKTKKVLEDLGCKAQMIQTGVDLRKFTPPTNEKVKSDLRRKYGLPSDKYIVLHVGHINRNRNVQFLGNIQCLDYVQAIAVGSTTYPEDEDLVKELKDKGVIVLTNYFRKIEEIYQCADCYLFPVFSEDACIEVPLSVLEAMASNLPVVTTKFRGLPNLVSEHDGLVYVNNKGEILSKINSVKSIPDPRTRDLVGQFSWENVVKQVLLDSILEQKSGTLF